MTARRYLAAAALGLSFAAPAAADDRLDILHQMLVELSAEIAYINLKLPKLQCGQLCIQDPEFVRCVSKCEDRLAPLTVKDLHKWVDDIREVHGYERLYD